MDEIKGNYLKDLLGLLRDHLGNKTSSQPSIPPFGIVVDNNDSEKFGRCKIRVYGMGMENIPDKDLPWFTPDQSFIGSLEGSFIVPPNGALVNCYFKNGDLYDPYYSTKVLNINNLPDERLEDYPDVQVLAKWDDGQYCIYNQKTYEFAFRHSSGAVLTINAQGNWDIDTTNSNIGQINITARGPMKFNAPTIEVPNGIVTPTGTGFWCAMPIDPLTGMPQTGNIGIRQGV